MENDELSPIRKTPDLKENGNIVRNQHGYPISGAVATENKTPTPYKLPERMAMVPGHDEQDPHHHASTPTRDFTNTSKKQSSADCPLEVCKIRNRQSTNFEGARPATGYGRTSSASSTPTSQRSTARSTARNTSRSTTRAESTTPVAQDPTTTRDSFLRSTTRSQPSRRRDTASTSQRSSATPSLPQLDRSPGRGATSPRSPRGTEVHERTSIGPRGQTLTTISKREDDDCSGGIVRWMEKCVHNKRPLPWGGSRWSEPGCHEYVPSCGAGYGGNNYQAQAPTPRGPKCNGCDKKYCYYPGMKAQQQAAQHDAMQNMPFMYPPSCPEDPTTNAQPARCNPRYGQPIPLAAYQQNYANRYTNPSEGINPPAKPCNPKNPSMNLNLVSHISGFEPPPVTQPINSHYVGYSQKYPQDVIKSNNI